MCGAVRYSATANPANSMICHCQSCRRSAASPVVAWVTFAKAEFRFTRGTPLEYESSPKVRRDFCGACGSPLAYEHLDTAGLRRRHHLQSGCAVGISAHASFLAQPRHRLGEVRRRTADLRALALWRSFLSSRPRASRCAGSISTTRRSWSTLLNEPSFIAEHRRSRRAQCRRCASLSARRTDRDVRALRLRTVARARASPMALPSACAACSSATTCRTWISATPIFPTYWGQGYAFEAAAATLRHAARQVRLEARDRGGFAGKYRLDPRAREARHALRTHVSHASRRAGGAAVRPAHSTPQATSRSRGSRRRRSPCRSSRRGRRAVPPGDRSAVRRRPRRWRRCAL